MSLIRTLEGIAWLGAAHGDGPGQNVRTRRGLELLAYLPMVRQHDRGIAHVGKAAGHGFDRYRVAGLNGEAWGDFCVEVAPVHGGRVGRERVMSRHAWLLRCMASHRWRLLPPPTSFSLPTHRDADRALPSPSPALPPCPGKRIDRPRAHRRHPLQTAPAPGSAPPRGLRGQTRADVA